jgi:hypothetical protein
VDCRGPGVVISAYICALRFSYEICAYSGPGFMSEILGEKMITCRKQEIRERKERGKYLENV